MKREIVHSIIIIFGKKICIHYKSFLNKKSRVFLDGRSGHRN